MKLTRRKIMAMYQATDALTDVKNIKVAYAVAKNRRVALQPTIDALQDIQKATPKYMEFENKRIEICKGFSDNIIENGNYKIRPEDQDAFNAKLKELQEEYKDVIDDQNNKQQQIDAFLGEEEEINLHTFTLEQLETALPSIDVKVLDGIYDMISE